MRTSAIIPPALDAFSARFGTALRTSSAARAQHTHQLTWIERQLPDAVLDVETRTDIVDALRICSEFSVPVVPYGAGTSLEGQVNAPMGGLCLSLSAMKKIEEIAPDDMYVVVEPGLTRQELNKTLRSSGLFFAVDPGSHATLGGMASTRASGTYAVKYGTMRQNVLEAEVVLASGEVIRVGGRTRKSAAGYDLVPLFVGAEGTLGVFSSLVLRVYPTPVSQHTALCQFADLRSAANTVIAAVQHGTDLARVELIDAVTVRALNAYSGVGLMERITILAEFHGSTARTEAEVCDFVALAHEENALHSEAIPDRSRANALWDARHNAWWAIHQRYPGRLGITTDTCVPISHLADSILAAQTALDEFGLDAAMVGHVGDGNFHVLILIDPKNPDHRVKAPKFVAKLNEIAWNFGGTCTGEHGIGQGKREFLVTEHGSSIDVMRRLKATLDPKAILNPGKIF